MQCQPPESPSALPTVLPTGTPIVVVVSFMSVGNCIPPSLTVSATASYKSPTGEPRTSHCEIALPLSLIATVVASARDPVCKFTLDTNQAPVHVPTLYQATPPLAARLMWR